MKGYPVCYLHGAGNPLRGRAGGRPIKHGRYSKRLPGELLERYKQALADRELLALRDEIAVLDARLAVLLERFDENASFTRWKRVEETVQTLLDALKRPDVDGQKAALHEHVQAIMAGRREEELWRDIYTLFEQRRRLVESERKRLVEMHQMLSVEEAMALMAAISDAIRKRVQDPQLLEAIGADITRLLS